MIHVTVESIIGLNLNRPLPAVNSLPDKEVIDAALNRLREMIDQRDISLMIEWMDPRCRRSVERSFYIKGEKISPICKQCGSALNPNGLCQRMLSMVD
jgi:hypothetical protein